MITGNALRHFHNCRTTFYQAGSGDGGGGVSGLGEGGKMFPGRTIVVKFFCAFQFFVSFLALFPRGLYFFSLQKSFFF